MGRSQGEVTVTTFCPHHEQPGALCPRCVTLISVALGTLEHATVHEIAALADDYALRILDDLPNVTSEAELRDGLAGALLSFMAEAILTAHNQRTEPSHSLRT
jgi:hypothetical protein